MRKLKDQGISWPELGRIYDVPWTTVYGRIRPRNRGSVKELGGNDGKG